MVELPIFKHTFEKTPRFHSAPNPMDPIVSFEEGKITLEVSRCRLHAVYTCLKAMFHLEYCKCFN